VRAVVAVGSLGAGPAASQPSPEDDGGGPGTTGPGYVPPDPDSWILVDADTGAVLDGADTRTPHLPASTVKLFTALVAVQRLPADDPVPISAVAAGMPARKINVKAGQVWDREDLLASLLLVSANDAAVALAERVGGGDLTGWERVAGTVAAALGLRDRPDLSDPAGLDDEFSHGGGSAISARDLAVVARAVLREPALMAIINTPEIRFHGGDGLDHHVVRHNRLFELYPGAIGLKTGLTDRAGRTFVGAARRDGRTMLVVLFDAVDIYATAGHLRDQGFATPVDAEAGLDRLPEVVPGAALDPPERIPGALDVVVAAAPTAGGGGGGLGVDWDSPPVALLVLLVGAVPALLVRRRLATSPGE
jgi:D-alanyl-D-alanine carboxypeptidase (penicillin-binding protein 5/6)